MAGFKRSEGDARLRSHGRSTDSHGVQDYEKLWEPWEAELSETVSSDMDERTDALTTKTMMDPLYPDLSREMGIDDTNESTTKNRRKKKSKSRSPEALLERAQVGSSPGKKSWLVSPVAENLSSTRETITLFTTFIVIFLTLMGCGALYYSAEHGYLSSVLHRVVRPKLLPVFDKKMAELKQQFPNQPNHNWAIVRAAFAEVLNSSEYNYGPAVLIVLASKKDQHLATCFADKLALSLAKSFNPGERPIILNGAKLSGSHGSVAAKHTIDNAVKDRDNFVMQFNSLEQIDHYTASIFHSLCDYYNSPFRDRAIFIFTVHTSEEVEGRKRKEYDEMADRVLNNVWHELDINKRSALIARLTGSTILLRKEFRRVC